MGTGPPAVCHRKNGPDTAEAQESAIGQSTPLLKGIEAYYPQISQISTDFILERAKCDFADALKQR